MRAELVGGEAMTSPIGKAMRIHIDIIRWKVCAWRPALWTKRPRSFPGRRLAYLTSTNYLLHILRGDQAGGLVELDAQPALHHRRVGESSLLDQCFHPRIAAGAFLDLDDPIGQPRGEHINLALLATDSAGTHGIAPCAKGS